MLEQVTEAEREKLVGILKRDLDPDGVLVGIVERRGPDIKSVINMPEEVAG